MPFQMSNLGKSDNDFMSGNNAVDISQQQIDFGTSLPHADSIPRNEIPVNKAQHRLDAFIAPPSLEDRATFNARTAQRKLCNNHHIYGNCPNGGSCPYDHKPASPGVLNCLKQVVRNNPCPKRGACRNLVCFNGHICQKTNCKWRGGKEYCKFNPQSHNVDLTLAEFVPVSGARDSAAESEVAGSISGKGSTPPMPEARSVAHESDGEHGGQEGALLDFDSEHLDD